MDRRMLPRPCRTADCNCLMGHIQNVLEEWRLSDQEKRRENVPGIDERENRELSWKGATETLALALALYCGMHRHSEVTLEACMEQARVAMPILQAKYLATGRRGDEGEGSAVQ